MKEKITANQLLALMILTPYATASLFYLASDTKRDVWIALMVYCVLSLIQQSIYIWMYNKYPNDSIVTYMPKVFGKYLGKVISILYILYFLYLASRNLRDFEEVITAFLMPNISLFTIGAFLMITVIYGVYKGVENLASLAQITLIMIMLINVSSWILLKMSRDVFEYTRVLPILNQGFFKTMEKGWMLITFPFGELIVFTMIYPMVIQKSKIRKAVYFATIIETIMLVANNLVFIFALGYHFAKAVNYPLLETYRLIHIGNFLNRLEVLFIVVAMWNGFFKVIIFVYCGALGASQMFKIKNWGLLSIVCGAAVLVESSFIAGNYPEHIKQGLDIAAKYIHIPLQLIIPIITIIFYNLKRIFIKRS